MAVTVNLYDLGQAAPISTLTSTLAWIGVSSDGVPNTVYQFDAPGLINPTVGHGPAPEGIGAGVRVSQTRQVYAAINPSVPGTVGSVSQSGTGPAITLSGTPYDSATPTLKIVDSGALGVAHFQVAMDGATFGPVLDVPAPVAASVVGTADLTGLTYSTLDTFTVTATPTNGVQSTCTFTSTTSANFLTQLNAAFGKPKVQGSASLAGFTYSSLDGLTLVVTTAAGVTLTCTFASTGSSNFLTQIDTAYGAAVTSTLSSSSHLVLAANSGQSLTIGAGTANTALGLTTGTVVYGLAASIVQGRYLMLTDGTTGQSSTLTIGAGTANTALGLSAGATTGAAATYTLPNTGVTATFPVGSYVRDERYTWTQTEPRFTATDLAAAITALQTSGVYFRDIVLLSNPIDGADTRALANQAGTSLRTLRGALPKVFAVLMMNGSIGLPAAVQANDTDVKANMQGHVDDFVTVAHGDCYMLGTAMPGSFRRPAVFSLGIRAASHPISEDPGSRQLPPLEETSMVAPDLITVARNEDTALIKMSTATPGFTVLRNEFSQAYFVQGLTRSSRPKFRYLPIMRTATEAARVVYETGRTYENSSTFLNANGTVREADANSIEIAFSEAIRDRLENDLSGWTVTVNRTTKVSQTNALKVRTDIEPKGYFYTVSIDIGVVDVLQ